MPGSHSKKDKLKKKIRKARKTVVRDKTNEGYEPTKLKGKKRIPPSRVSPNWAVTKKSYPTSDYQRKVEYEQDKELGEDAVSISESNAKKYSKLKKRIAKKSIRKDEDVFKKIKETGNKMLKEKTERESKRPLIKEVPFGKRRTTIDDRKFESFDRMSAEENARITGKKIRPKKPTQKERSQIIKAKLSKIRKADQQDINRVKRWNSRSFNKKRELSGTTEPVFKTTAAIKPLTGRPDLSMRGDELTAKLRKRIAKFRQPGGPQFNISNKEHRRWVQQDVDPQGGLNKYDYEPSSYPIPDKFAPKKPDLNRKNVKLFDYEDPDLTKKYFSGNNMKQKPRVSKVKKRLAKVRKADGGIAPNYNNPSQVHKPSKIRKKKSKTAARSPVNKAVNRVNVIKPTKAYKKPPQGPNPDAQTPEAIRKNAEVVGRNNASYIGKTRKRVAKLPDWKPKKGKYPVVHPEKYSTGGDLLDRITAVRDYKLGLFTPEDEIKFTSQIIKNGLPNPFLRPDYGEAVKVTKSDLEGLTLGADAAIKTGVISPAGEINWKQFEDLVGQYDKGLGEGKTVDEIADTAVVKKVRPSKPTDKDRGDVMEAKLRNKIARIRKAGEQIDPRVKKRKTVRPDSPVQKVSQLRDRVTEMKTAKEHNHKIEFKSFEGSQYRRASLTKQEGKYAKYWLLNAKQTNGNGWGVSRTSIAKNIHKFIGRPFVITAKQWIPESEYGEQFEHPYLPTNNIENIISHQEKFRVGSIVDVIEKDGDYHAVIEINSKFANMMLPPFCSPAIFQNNPGEADGDISDWEALHLAGLMEDPAYGARIALLKGSCLGTAEACSIQFKAAKQTTMCPKKKAKLVRRLDRLGD